MELTPTTELEAVNEMLKAIGEIPVNTLGDLGFTDAAIARDTLRTKWRELLTRGWYFNKDTDYTFTPAADGRVVLPPNVMAVLPSNLEVRTIVPRNGLLWNATDRTDTFAQDSGPTMNVVWLFSFENLPESARRLITVRAVTKFQTDQQGSEVNYKFTQDDERFALSTLLYEERLYEPKANMFNDSTDVSEVIER
jgi:hypothetical protein